MRILIKNTGKLLKTRENAGDQVTIGFTFASDSLMHDVNFHFTNPGLLSIID